MRSRNIECSRWNAPIQERRNPHLYPFPKGEAKYPAANAKHTNEARFLRHQKDLVGVGIFYLGPRRETANINVALIRRVGAGHKSGLIRDGNAIRQIALGCPGRWRSGGFRLNIVPRCLGRCWRLVRIIWLGDWLIFRRIRITRNTMTHRRLISARYEKKAGEKNEPR